MEQTIQQRIAFIIFCQSLGYNAVSKVRANANGYMYVTLANTQTGKAENLYLGRRFSETVTIGEILPIKDLWVTEVENEHGEARFKLTDKSGIMSESKLAEYQTF